MNTARLRSIRCAGLAVALLATQSPAEISGSGTPHADCPYAIGDKVWRDLNGNGIQDAGEPGIGGVVIRLERGSWPDTEHLVDTTDSDGHYRFYNLCNGSYWLDLDEATLPGDLTPTDDNEDAHEALDNDADFLENRHHVTVSSSRPLLLTVDFGFRQGACDARIAGRVWYDTDRDGYRHPDERGIKGATVELTDANGAPIANGSTDSHGRYRFDELCAGSYRLDVDESKAPVESLVPAPTGVGYDGSLDSDGPTDGGWLVVEAIDGEHYELDFGYYHPKCTGRIGDRVFVDDNSDGIQQEGEAGLAGVTLTLSGAGDAVAEARSDNSGRFAFPGLCAGEYELDLEESTLPGSYTPTQATAGGDPAIDSNAPEAGGAVFVQLSSDDAIDESVDFGFVAGCGGRIGDRVWVDLDTDGAQDIGEPGLGGVDVVLRDAEGRQQAVDTSDDNGNYAFAGLCAGDYAVQVDADSVPQGAAPTATDSTHDTADSDGLAPVWVTLEDGQLQDLTIDFGYVVDTACLVALDSACLVAAPDKAHYVCNKQVDELVLVWNGTQPVRVVAHRGKTDDAVLADIDPVEPGDEIAVSGFASGTNDVVSDVEYAVYEPGTDRLIGISRFNIDCADDDMDGPEDCGTAQGDGKDDKQERINDWRLEGMTDQGGVLDCTVDLSQAADRCEFRQTEVSCDTIEGYLHFMTVAYVGGDCADSEQGQGDKFKCSGQVDDGSAIDVVLEDDSSFTVEPGQVFVLPRHGGDTKLDVSNAAGTQHLEIHTSCSKPLATGDRFGALVVLAINGKGVGTDVMLVHTIDNAGTVDIDSVSAGTADGPTLQGGSVAAGAYRLLVERVYVAATESLGTLAQAHDIAGGVCVASDTVSIDASPPPPCTVRAVQAFEFHDKEVRWQLRNEGIAGVHLDTLSLAWPDENGQLDEIKLGGDKVFDTLLDGPAAFVGAADWSGNLNKREIKSGELVELKLKFKNNASVNAGDYALELTFDRGCTVSP